jgi:hypothetical protein
LPVSEGACLACSGPGGSADTVAVKTPKSGVPVADQRGGVSIASDRAVVPGGRAASPSGTAAVGGMAGAFAKARAAGETCSKDAPLAGPAKGGVAGARPVGAPAA